MKLKSPFATFAARAFMMGCGFRVMALVLFIIFCFFSNSYKADDLNPIAQFIGNVLAVVLFFDVDAIWPGKPLVDLVADPELGYKPKPYLFIILPLCLLVGTLSIGFIACWGKIIVDKIQRG